MRRRDDSGITLLQPRKSRPRPSRARTALHSTEVHTRDVGDLLTALSLELPEAEDQLVMLRQLLHHLLDQPLKMTLPEEIVGLHRGVLELKGAMVVVPIAGELLEEYQGAPRPVAQLVLGEVARDRVDPGGELLGGVEPMQMPGYADEGLLDQILSPIAISGLPGDEVHQPVPIAAKQKLERSVAPIQMRGDELLVREGVERPGHPVLCCRGGRHISSHSSRLSRTIIVSDREYHTSGTKAQVLFIRPLEARRSFLESDHGETFGKFGEKRSFGRW